MERLRFNSRNASMRKDEFKSVSLILMYFDSEEKGGGKYDIEKQKGKGKQTIGKQHINHEHFIIKLKSECIKNIILRTFNNI